MSKDIRSFFKLTKDKKKKDEDSDVIPESPDVEIKQKKKQIRKRRQIKDDSDEEIFSPPKKKTPPKSNLKEVKATDLFGNGPIKRTEPLVRKANKKIETNIPSDEEFEKSLMQIDELENEILSPKKDQVNTIESKQSKPKKSNSNIETEIESVKSEKSLNNYNSVDKNDKLSKKERKEEKINNIKTENECTKSEKPVNNNDCNDKNKIIPKKDNNLTPSNKRKFDISCGKNAKQDEKKTYILKKMFGEFLENDTQPDHEETVEEPKQKRRKMDKSLNESVLTDEEIHERKRHSAALYQKYLNRSGPKHLGSKEIPEGAPNCFKNYTFLLTGVLDSFERDEIVAAITKYGGCIKSGISKKVTHVLAGEDGGPAKLAKAQELGIKIIDENKFLQMIKDSTKNSPPKIAKKQYIDDKKLNESICKKIKTTPSPKDKETNRNKLSLTNIIKKEPESAKKINKGDIKKPLKSEDFKETVKLEIIDNSENKSDNSKVITNTLMWVDKYKPQNLKQIIGQHGEASNVNKLLNWLTKWYTNRKAKLPKPSPWAKNDDGGFFKAALLSGPPGVGKTTTVSLVCKELGFDMVEFNASDTRSKNLIKQQIGELLTTTSLSGYAKGNTGKGAVSKKHVLVMDEVDGMAGNEDRGGLQELIALIKSTSVPIVCMCNDRNSEKMRTLVNYCYDLRFNRPRVDQIKSALMSICFKEGLKIPNEALSQLIVSSGQDVRQALHRLSLAATDGQVAGDIKNMKKDVKMGPWESIRKVFSAEEHKSMSIYDKSDLFFTDYSIMPLFVQENYLSVAPHCPKHEVLERISKAADSISIGDMIDSRIRGQQAWSLLPMQAMYSCVIPGQVLEGHVAGQIQFPAWLGKNSRKNKMHRLCQEIHAHTRLSTSGSKSSIFLDYSYYLRDAVVNPLIKDKSEGIDQSLKVLESYHLLRDDLDSLVELSLWPSQRNPTILIDSKVKAAMTRTYNKKATALPYAPAAFKRGRAQEHDENTQEDEEGLEEDSDPENDALIKKKKNKDTEKPSISKAGKGKQNDTSSPIKGKGKKNAPKQGKKK